MEEPKEEEWEWWRDIVEEWKVEGWERWKRGVGMYSGIDHRLEAEGVDVAAVW